MLRRISVASAVAALACLVPGAAHAAFFAAEPVDGPFVGVKAVGDFDIARDGTGAVTYVRGDQGADRVFVSRLVNGAFQAPERVDAAVDAPVTDAAVAVSDGGRVVVVWIGGGGAFAAVRPAADQPFSAPQLLATGASDPSVDMSIHGVAYASFTVAGDVRVARLNRRETQFAVLPDAADVDPAREAGVGTGRSHIATNAEGSAVVVFGERVGATLRVIGRRVFRDRMSVAPQDLTLPELEGRPGGEADLPVIDIEDDSSFAWAVFRQEFGGQHRAIARRLVGSQFESPAVADAVGWGTGDGVASTRVEISGRGEGLLTTAQAGGVVAAVIKDNKPLAARPLGGGGAASQPAGGVGENLDRVAAWIDGDVVRGVFYDDDEKRRTEPLAEAPVVLSNPGLGPVVPAAGFDAAVDRVGDGVAVFVQGDGPDARLMAAVYDRPPGSFVTTTTSKWRKYARPRLAWATPLDLWGPLSYRIEIDGQVVGTSSSTKVTLPNRVPDGIHSWRVVAIDRRGQETASAARTLRVDATKPKVSAKVSRSGRVVRVTVKANDVIPKGARASGIGVVRITWGDGTTTTNPKGRKATHRYFRGGRVTIKVSAHDKAGNVAVYRKRLRL